MASSEERRKVAERMRVYSHDFDFRDSDPFWYVAKAAFGDVDTRTYYSVFARLAELIDPTCYVVSEKRLVGGFGCEEAGITFTLSCGHETTVDGDYLPNHCSECGARVVSGDDQR